jgi:hypothetical protein
MNIAKNMEAIFVIAVALAGVTGFASAAASEKIVPTNVVTTQYEGKMQVVTVSAKRLTAAEKAELAE